MVELLATTAVQGKTSEDEMAINIKGNIQNPLKHGDLI
jgi:hypothetical protein